MRRHTEGFYTVEAAILVPFVLLAVLSFGILIRSEGIWENCVHCAADESSAAAAIASKTPSALFLPLKIRKRIRRDVPQAETVSVKGFRSDFTEKETDHLTQYRLCVSYEVPLPAGFTRRFRFASAIRYRGFAGRSPDGTGLGKEGLENGVPEDPVLIFPQQGKRYHHEGCSYVQASFEAVELSSSLRSSHPACGACHSEQQRNGAIVYCFSGEDTAFHIGSCRMLEKHTIVIDRTEAEQQGFSPCSRCCASSQ